MKNIIIDHYLYKVTDKEAKKLETLSDKSLYDEDAEKEFHDYCNELHIKYSKKVVFIQNIYKTI